jgi:hypothetical protein
MVFPASRVELSATITWWFYALTSLTGANRQRLAFCLCSLFLFHRDEMMMNELIGPLQNHLDWACRIIIPFYFIFWICIFF